MTTVTRANVRRIIANEISNLKANIEALEVKQRKEEQKKTDNINTAEEQKPLYTTKLTNYGNYLNIIVLHQLACRKGLI